MEYNLQTAAITTSTMTTFLFFFLMCVLETTLEGKKVLRKDGICHQPVSDYKYRYIWL